jgi:hypothetical protein
VVRPIVAGLLGGFIFFVWGMLTWTIVPLHVATVKALPDESAVTQALKAQDLPSGVYVAPWTDDEEDWNDPESEWTRNHLAGPLYAVFYRSEGGPPMDPKVMVGGLVIDALGGLVAAFLLVTALPRCPAYWQRTAFVTGLGAFAAIITHLGYWIWMNFATDWTVAFVVDTTVGWTLAGAAMAAILRPRVEKTPTPDAA